MAFSSSINGSAPESEALDRVDAQLAVRYAILPLRIDDDGRLMVAMENPADLDVLDELSLALQCDVVGEQVPKETIVEAIREYYGVGADTLEQLIDSRDLQVISDCSDSSIDDASTDASIIKFVNQIIVDAYSSRATDIHLEPFENKLRVRYRIDGILFDTAIPESIKHFRESIVSRIKIMANLDIAERRLPQDGRIRVRISGKDFDLRVSVIPIAHGESVNIRILQRSTVMLGMEAIGFAPDTQQRFTKLLDKSHGIILVTGPTGSGKTTTLYSCLNKINESERKIITVEDPIEYEIEGICQMHARPDIGLTFAMGLRSMLRHDPDVMLVGEIRDFETAELAIRCALTGHLVFSTLHTNDAAGAMPRLTDIGIEPYLLASSVEAIMAQRLVRKVCPHCAEPFVPDSEMMEMLDEDITDANAGFIHGTGCEQCRDSGYFDRTAIHEMFQMNDEIRQLVIRRASGADIKRQVLKDGMAALRQDGLAKARQGKTTIEEVLRVTQDERDV
jgi:type II secretion system protein E